MKRLHFPVMYLSSFYNKEKKAKKTREDMKSNLNKIITKGYPLTKNRNILGAWQNKTSPSSGREGGPQKQTAQQSLSGPGEN